MIKIYSKIFNAIPTGTRDEFSIQVSERFELKKVSFSSMTDKVFLGLKVDEKDRFSPDLVNISALKEDSGNEYRLDDPIMIDGKKTITIKILNSTGTTLNDFTVALHGNATE